MAFISYRAFLDTSVYIAALLSPKGAAGELLRLAETGAVRFVVCEEVIVETDRVLSVKFPLLIEESRKLWKHLKPEMVLGPPPDQLKPFLQKLKNGDAVILGAAKQAKVAAFVTWNTRDFMRPDVLALVDFPIVVPGDALTLFRKWIDPFLR